MSQTEAGEGEHEQRVDSFSGVCAPMSPVRADAPGDNSRLDSEIEAELAKMDDVTTECQGLKSDSEFSELLCVGPDRKRNDLVPGSTFGVMFSSAMESSAHDAPLLKPEPEPVPEEEKLTFPFKVSETDGKSETILLDSEVPNSTTLQSEVTVAEVYHEALDKSEPIEETATKEETQETTPRKSARKNALLRPKTATARHKTVGLTGMTMKKIAEISQRTSRMQSNVPESFRQMILGAPKPTGPTAWEIYQTALESKREASPYTQEESERIATDLVNGEKRKIVNAAGIADVIDELTKMLVEAMEAREYTRSEKIKNIIMRLRKGFRKEDRERCQKERLNSLRQQIAEAETQLSTAKRGWKDKETEFKETRDRLAHELDAKHDQELRECCDQWSCDKKRIYTKRSSVLLNQMVMEKKLSLIGEFMQADAVKKVNMRNEKEEIDEKFWVYSTEFETARRRILQRHETEIQEFNATKDRQFMIMQKKADDEIERHTRRLNTLKKLLEDESNIDIFTAKRFKKGADPVLPMSASLRGGEDIPTAGKTKKAKGDDGALMRYRESNSFPALSLPPLKFRRLRHKPRAFVAAKKPPPKIEL